MSKPYTSTKTWKKFRKKAIEHYNNKCSLCKSDCGNKPFVNRIKFNKPGREEFQDVYLLCEECHKIQYETRKREKKKMDDEFNQIIR